jgi:saccharopine dehydrogenase (NAD+, L-lysine forming)
MSRAPSQATGTVECAPRIAIIGAYGAIGKVVSHDLYAHTQAPLIVAGRDRDRAQVLAAELGERASARHVDLYDAESLDALCQECDLLVNCAGPSHYVRDRVVRAAVAQGRHFVDAGGAEASFPELTRSWAEPQRAGLTTVVDAGWIPGISGVLAHLLVRRAHERMESVDRVELWYGDRSAWSLTGVIDILELIRMRPGLGEYVGGSFVARPRGALRRVRLPKPFGSRIATLSFATELRQLAEANPHLDVASWAVPMMSAQSAFALVSALTALRDRPATGARLLAAAMSRDPRAADGGFVAVAATGTRDGRPAAIRAYLAAPDSPYLTGLACATAARLIADERLAPGCCYLCDAVDPDLFLGELGILDRVRWSAR